MSDDSSPSASAAKIEETIQAARASDLGSIDDEIKKLRELVWVYAVKYSYDFERILKGMHEIVSAVTARYRMNKANADEFGAAVAATITAASAQFYRRLDGDEDV